MRARSLVPAPGALATSKVPPTPTAGLVRYVLEPVSTTKTSSEFPTATAIRWTQPAWKQLDGAGSPVGFEDSQFTPWLVERQRRCRPE